MAETRRFRTPTRRGPGEGIAAHDPVIVVGLGRFGATLAEHLVALGHEVLGVDTDAAIVQRHSRVLTQTVEAAFCGHATLASVHVLTTRHGVEGPVRLTTEKVGPLTVASR